MTMKEAAIRAILVVVGLLLLALMLWLFNLDVNYLG